MKKESYKPVICQLIDNPRIVFYTIIGIALALLCIAFVSGVSVESYGSDYIVWNASGSTNLSLDGEVIVVSGMLYGQYDLTPNTIHFMRDDDTGITISATTNKSGLDYLTYWIFIMILFGSLITAYLYPISCAFTLIYGSWLIADYLPGEVAGGYSYVLVVIGMGLGVFVSYKGMRKI